MNEMTDAQKRMRRRRMLKEHAKRVKELQKDKPKARRLKAIAEWINKNSKEYKAEIVESYCNTDRKVGRLRSPGLGREGNKIIIRNRETDEIVKEHNSAETYRQNSEVEQWVKWNITDKEEI